MKKYEVLIFAPRPPPVGGIASITSMLYQSFKSRRDVSFISPVTKSSSFTNNLIRPLLNIFRLFKVIILLNKGGRILFFSGAGKSFFEKLIWSSMAIFLGRRPIMVMVDGNFPVFWDRTNIVLAQLVFMIMRTQNLVLAVQSDVWRKYYSDLFPLARINLVSATVNEDFFISAPQVDPKPRINYFLYVGWIIEEKGIFDLFDAMKLVIKEYPTAKLRLVGPLFDQDHFWSCLVTEMGLTEQVEFVGEISDHNRVISELKNASVFVFPSHAEGFPVALLEALTIGLPCIGTAIGGISEILDHGKAGILVTPKSPLELSVAMRSVLSDQTLIDTYSKEAFKRARTIYNQAAFVESYEILLGLDAVNR